MAHNCHSPDVVSSISVSTCRRSSDVSDDETKEEMKDTDEAPPSTKTSLISYNVSSHLFRLETNQNQSTETTLNFTGTGYCGPSSSIFFTGPSGCAIYHNKSWICRIQDPGVGGLSFIQNGATALAPLKSGKIAVMCFQKEGKHHHQHLIKSITQF